MMTDTLPREAGSVANVQLVVL